MTTLWMDHCRVCEHENAFTLKKVGSEFLSMCINCETLQIFTFERAYPTVYVDNLIDLTSGRYECEVC